MHNYTYTSVKALQDERLRRHGSTMEPTEPARFGLRQRIGHNLIHLGERLARIESHEKLGEAA